MSEEQAWSRVVSRHTVTVCVTVQFLVADGFKLNRSEAAKSGKAQTSIVLNVEYSLIQVGDTVIDKLTI